MKKMQKADGQSKKKGTDWRRSGFAWILTALFLFWIIICGAATLFMFFQVIFSINSSADPLQLKIEK